jgi:hypothetical protein
MNLANGQRPRRAQDGPHTSWPPSILRFQGLTGLTAGLLPERENWMIS